MARVPEAPAAWYERLTTAYAEPHRHYHNQRHIAECLVEFDEAQHLSGNAVAIELALWFHDAVYDPRAVDNEEQSVVLLKRCAAETSLAHSLVKTACELVVATKHHSSDTNPDASLLIDIDLSIFGKGKERFCEYEEQIRQEYSWVPEPLFSSKRAEILDRFLARKAIYATEWFRKKYERQARHNLEVSILELRRRT